MAALSVKAAVNTPKSNFTRTDLVGTETIDAHVGAGEVAFIIDSGVRLDSIAIDNLAKELAEHLRENLYAA